MRTEFNMDKTKIFEIENVLRGCLRNKLPNYNLEPASMPFHTRLLGKNRGAYSEIIFHMKGI
ncbi:MAG: hypothetical protein C0412_17615 [Flavobacterium sp.]|nr:hypothetical protein [Flavobacterium sp.]